MSSPRVGNPRVGVSASCPVSAGATDRFAFARVRVGRYLYRRVEPDAELLQKVARELVAVDELDDSRVKVQLDADVEVVGAIELVFVGWRLRHAVTIQDRTCDRQRSLDRIARTAVKAGHSERMKKYVLGPLR